VPPPGLVDDVTDFANETRRRGAIGLVVALSFDDGVRGAPKSEGVHPLDHDDLLQIVSLWDSAKQRIAASSLMYCFQHVEKHTSLVDRLTKFLDGVTTKKPGQK